MWFWIIYHAKRGKMRFLPFPSNRPTVIMLRNGRTARNGTKTVELFVESFSGTIRLVGGNGDFAHFDNSRASSELMAQPTVCGEFFEVFFASRSYWFRKVFFPSKHRSLHQKLNGISQWEMLHFLTVFMESSTHEMYSASTVDVSANIWMRKRKIFLCIFRFICDSYWLFHGN